jgi:hypothetical protein
MNVHGVRWHGTYAGGDGGPSLVFRILDASEALALAPGPWRAPALSDGVRALARSPAPPGKWPAALVLDEVNALVVDAAHQNGRIKAPGPLVRGGGRTVGFMELERAVLRYPDDVDRARRFNEYFEWMNADEIDHPVGRGRLRPGGELYQPHYEAFNGRRNLESALPDLAPR